MRLACLSGAVGVALLAFVQRASAEDDLGWVGYARASVGVGVARRPIEYELSASAPGAAFAAVVGDRGGPAEEAKNQAFAGGKIEGALLHRSPSVVLGPRIGFSYDRDFTPLRQTVRTGIATYEIHGHSVWVTAATGFELQLKPGWILAIPDVGFSTVVDRGTFGSEDLEGKFRQRRYRLMVRCGVGKRFPLTPATGMGLMASIEPLFFPFAEVPQGRATLQVFVDGWR